jgi:predicted transcriptional regulator
MGDKSLLKKAVQNFDNLTKSQKAVLNIIIEFATDDIANISVESIARMCNISKTIIYKNFIKLERLGLISREKIANEPVGYIKLHTKAFQPMIEFYLKKQEFFSKIS